MTRLPLDTIRIRLGHESLDVTLAYLKGRQDERNSVVHNVFLLENLATVDKVGLFLMLPLEPHDSASRLWLHRFLPYKKSCADPEVAGANVCRRVLRE